MPMAPVPARVDAATKQVLLDLLDHAAGHGWPLVKTCDVLGLDVRRARRWVGRAKTTEGLVDARPGGSVNALRPCEEEAIVSAFEVFGEKDFSHRRLAYRGSYEGLFWAAPSTVRRVLNAHDLRFRHPPRPSPSQRRPFPDWASYAPGSIWIYDQLHSRRTSGEVPVEAVADRMSVRGLPGGDLVGARLTRHQTLLGHDGPDEVDRHRRHVGVGAAGQDRMDAADAVGAAAGRERGVHVAGDLGPPQLAWRRLGLLPVVETGPRHAEPCAHRTHGGSTIAGGLLRRNEREFLAHCCSLAK